MTYFLLLKFLHCIFTAYINNYPMYPNFSNPGFSTTTLFCSRCFILTSTYLIIACLTLASTLNYIVSPFMLFLHYFLAFPFDNMSLNILLVSFNAFLIHSSYGLLTFSISPIPTALLEYIYSPIMLNTPK